MLAFSVLWTVFLRVNVSKRVNKSACRPCKKGAALYLGELLAERSVNSSLFGGCDFSYMGSESPGPLPLAFLLPVVRIPRAGRPAGQLARFMAAPGI